VFSMRKFVNESIDRSIRALAWFRNSWRSSAIVHAAAHVLRILERRARRTRGDQSDVV
jgi:hypothetical protein